MFTLKETLVSGFTSLLLVGGAAGTYWRSTDMELVNTEGSPMYVWIDGANQIKTVLEPYETIRIPFPASGSAGEQIGSLRAYPGCNSGPCTTYANTATKLEWAINGQGHGRDWFDVSLVDGYNTRMQVDFPDSYNCPQLNTYVSQQDVVNNCPSPNLLVVTGTDGKEYASCMSDCKVAEQRGDSYDRARFCCLGNHHRHGTCSASNQYLRDFVHSSRTKGLAYLWPHDNKEQFTCNIARLMRVTLGGTGGISSSGSSISSKSSSSGSSGGSKHNNVAPRPKTTIYPAAKPSSKGKNASKNKPDGKNRNKNDNAKAEPTPTSMPEPVAPVEEQVKEVVVNPVMVTPNGETEISPKNSKLCWIMFNSSRFGCHKQ